MCLIVGWSNLNSKRARDDLVNKPYRPVGWPLLIETTLDYILVAITTLQKHKHLFKIHRNAICLLGWRATRFEPVLGHSTVSWNALPNQQRKALFYWPILLRIGQRTSYTENASMAWRRHWWRRSGADTIKWSNSEIITNVNIEDDAILPRNWCSGFTLMLYFKGIISPLGLHVFASYSLCTHQNVCILNKTVCGMQWGNNAISVVNCEFISPIEIISVA